MASTVPVPHRSDIKHTMLFLSLIVTMGFLFFVHYYHQHLLDQANHRINNHAQVIASALWTFDRSGPLAYLYLAADANGYQNITIYDGSNIVFLAIDGPPLPKIDRFLSALRLIRVHHLSANIVYEDLTIGRITAEWPNRSIYTYLNIALLVTLLLIGIALLLKLIEAKKSLEGRVRLRTAELENEISERKRTEEELQSQTQRLTLHVMNTPLGVIEWDMDFKVVEWNKAAEFIFEYSKDEALGKKGVNLIVQDTEQTQVNTLWRQLVTHSGGSRSVNMNRTKSGAIKTCEWYNTTLNDHHGRIIGVASLVLDITERKRTEEKNQLLQAQLLQAQKMEAVGNLAGGIAHDFNNILQTITGNTQLLLVEIPTQDQRHLKLRSIETAAKRAAELVKQLLTFSRKIESNLRPLNLNHEINQVREILKRTIPKMITIDLQLDDQLNMINADSVQIEQVLLNLAINAMHAMPHDGILTIQTQNTYQNEEFCRKHIGAHEGYYVQLGIRDTGTGINKEVISHIFEPFFTTKAVGQGTGLGLSIVYGIVKNHRAFIECHSTPGNGTTFLIFFPAITDDLPEHTAPNGENGNLPGGSETILIIDDEESIRDIGKEILLIYGYTVLCADTGEAGLATLTSRKDNPIDLIILDLNMPGMGGFKCLQKIRENYPAIPVLITSGYTPTEVVQYVMKHGANGVIAKPFQLFDLLRTIRRTIEETSA